jgi:hypothetical protein
MRSLLFLFLVVQSPFMSTTCGRKRSVAPDSFRLVSLRPSAIRNVGKFVDLSHRERRPPNDVRRFCYDLNRIVVGCAFKELFVTAVLFIDTRFTLLTGNTPPLNQFRRFCHGCLTCHYRSSSRYIRCMLRTLMKLRLFIGEIT